MLGIITTIAILVVFGFLLSVAFGVLGIVGGVILLVVGDLVMGIFVVRTVARFFTQRKGVDRLEEK